MKARQRLPRNQVMAMAVFVLLAALVLVLWFMDPAHRTSGESRIDWPPASSTKP
jgi:type II secretory pathway component PulM